MLILIKFEICVKINFFHTVKNYPISFKEIRGALSSSQKIYIVISFSGDVRHYYNPKNIFQNEMLYYFFHNLLCDTHFRNDDFKIN